MIIAPEARVAPTDSPAHDTGGAEPVAWTYRLKYTCDGSWGAWKDPTFNKPEFKAQDWYTETEVRPLYTAPQPPVPGGQSDGWRQGALAVIAWLEKRGYQGLANAARYLADKDSDTPAPSNAGEDEAAFVERMERANDERARNLQHLTRDCKISHGTMQRLIALARRGLNAPTQPAESAGESPFIFTYRNHRGEIGERHVRPLSVRYGSTKWHPEPQWLLRAWDLDKMAEREFAMANIGTTRPAGDEVTEAVVAEREACAKICDAVVAEEKPRFSDIAIHRELLATKLAAALRARTGR